MINYKSVSALLLRVKSNRCFVTKGKGEKLKKKHISLSTYKHLTKKIIKKYIYIIKMTINRTHMHMYIHVHQSTHVHTYTYMHNYTNVYLHSLTLTYTHT